MLTNNKQNLVSNSILSYDWLVEDSEDEKIFSRVDQIKSKYRIKTFVNLNQNSFIEKKTLNLNLISQSSSSSSFKNKKRFCYQLEKDAQNHSYKINETHSEQALKQQILLQKKRQNRPLAGLIRQKDHSTLSTEHRISQSNYKEQQNHSESIKPSNSFLSINTSDKPETKKLFGLIRDQISYDQQLRRAKQCFQKIMGEEKYIKLQEELKQLGVLLGQEEIKEKFKVQQSEFNPFHASTEMTINQIAQKYIDAQNHYKTNLKHKLSLKRLREEKVFSILSTEVSVSNFVTFVNCGLKSQYRNRDFVIFIERFTSSASTETPDHPYLSPSSLKTFKLQTFLQQISL